MNATRRLTLAALFALAACNGPAATPRPMPQKALEALVMGRTADEVVARLGPPDRADQTYGLNGSPDGRVWWYYDDLIRETADPKPAMAKLTVVNGRVVVVERR